LASQSVSLLISQSDGQSVG